MSVLLTGASGVVGQALLRELTDRDVICLVHRRPVVAEGVRTVTGDLTSPRLGLTRPDYDALVASVDAIIHCGAITGFSAGGPATEEVNVRGTAELLDLAAAASAPFYYVSTAFVARAELTRDRQGQSGEGSARPEAYLDSKRAAERLVRERGGPAAIIRPSVLIGDSVTGEIAAFQGLYTIFAAAFRNALPLLPLAPRTLIDFVPQDLVARSIAALVRGGHTGGEYWITAGGAAITIERLVELAVSTGRAAGLPMQTPRLVSFDMVDRLIRPVFIDPLPSAARRRFDDMLAMTALFGTAQRFETSYDRLPGVSAPDAAEVERACVTSMRHFIAAKKMVRQQPAGVA